MYNREEHNLDDFLRQKLGSQTIEPREGSWENISSRLEPPGGFMGTFRHYLNQFILPALTGIIMFSGIAISLSGSDRIVSDEAKSISEIKTFVPEKNTAGNLSAIPVQKESLREVPVDNTNNSTANSNITETTYSNKSTSNPITLYATARAIENEEKPLPADKEKNVPVTGNTSGNTITETTAAAGIASVSHNKHTSFEERSNSVYELPLRNFISVNTDPLIEQTFYTEKYGEQLFGSSTKEFLMRPVWSIGLYYIPELYYSEDLHGEKQLFAFDATMRYGFYDYFIETGFGISRVRNDNKFVVTYNDFLGTYNSLDSISFKIDSLNGGVVPSYYWTETLVYDSLNKAEETRSKNYYTYLQIPLYIGYEYNYKRLSFSLKGGPLFSLLIHKKEPELFFDEESKRVIAIDDNTPGRLRTNWQLLFYGGIRYKITNNWSVSLEPGIRLYLDQVYDKDKYSSKLPYSVNLRTGLLYTF